MVENVARLSLPVLMNVHSAAFESVEALSVYRLKALSASHWNRSFDHPEEFDETASNADQRLCTFTEIRRQVLRQPPT
ncbi:hypothetical protein [Amycolatopsis sp.]|uniref:hypothetical protein n=1 Tax=Amycolatopsis sp. TaxID=37632 RepID=UPI002D802545|nr:hypothetical protein [Amycolatopsis sp.]HET6705248.1 hypothetical protein [Amycolatopsis sp.]